MSMNVRIKDTFGAEKKIRGLPKVTKEALVQGVQTWHSDMAPGHFKPIVGLRNKYPQAAADGLFRDRTVRYQRRKIKRYGHQRILEFTGTAKTEILASVRITGSAQRVRGAMQGARIFNRVKNHDMRGELLATNEEEFDKLKEVVHKPIEQFLASKMPEQTKKV